MHRSEVDDGIGCDVVLVQSPAGFVEPNAVLWPPHGVVRPIHGNVWKKKKKSRLNNITEWNSSMLISYRTNCSRNALHFPNAFMYRCSFE